MATPAPRPKADTLNISFDYDVEPSENDRVEIITGRKVQKITKIGGSTEVGEVLNVRKALKECTVRTPFSINRQDRIAGEDLVPGPFVFGPGNKPYQFTPGAPSAITASVAGPYAIVLNTNDTLKVRVGNGAIQTFTITAGAALTAAAIAAEINETAVGFVASASTDGKLVLTALAIGVSLEIVQDTVEIVSSAAGPYAIVQTTGDGLVVKVGTGSNQTFAFTAGATVAAATIAAKINETATGFSAGVTAAQKLRLVAANPRTALEIIASGSTAATALGLTAGAVTTEDCYTTVGLTPGVVDGAYPSHESALVGGLVVVGGAAGAVVETLEY
jgi:hypothetical protein